MLSSTKALIYREEVTANSWGPEARSSEGARERTHGSKTGTRRMLASLGKAATHAPLLVV